MKSLYFQVTLVYSSGQMMRISLPLLATSLVTKAMEAVKQLLPRELALQLHAQWYTTRHAPGPTPTPADEWDMFCKCILAMSGYQGWKLISFSHCQELCQQTNRLLIGCTRVNNQSEAGSVI